MGRVNFSRQKSQGLRKTVQNLCQRLTKKMAIQEKERAKSLERERLRHSGGRCAKIFARNHQYLGVNEAIESYKARKLKDGKLGVFWHTQGSGKSYSMVFLAQKIRRQFTGSPTFVVLTDREELNKQISDTFEACGLLSGKARQYIPSSGAKLYEMLGP